MSYFYTCIKVIIVLIVLVILDVFLVLYYFQIEILTPST